MYFSDMMNIRVTHFLCSDIRRSKVMNLKSSDVSTPLLDFWRDDLFSLVDFSRNAALHQLFQ